MLRELKATRQSARQTTTLHPGLPLTTTRQSPSKGLRYSTDLSLGGELEMLMSASQTSFQLLTARCSLGGPSLATLPDLALMGNTSLS